MILAKISKGNIPEFLKRLMASYEVVAPVEKEGKFAFSPVSDPAKVRLDYDTTILPPKQFLNPPEEKLMEFKRDGSPGKETIDTTKRVLFGLHPCDIWGIQILDWVFDGKFPDPYYQARKNNTLIVGLNCTGPRNEYCFCQSMGTYTVDKGYDLMLMEEGDSYMVHIKTDAGNQVMRKNSDLFTEVSTEDTNILSKDLVDKKMKAKFKRKLDTRNISELLDFTYGSPVWKEYGDKCLSCGACSYVCPDCYCFNVKDKLDLGLQNGERTRTWDCCLYVDFARCAGGHNFRKDKATRLKMRFFHKEKSFVDEHGRPACVGCGRCIKSCPAKIDLTEIFAKLRGA
jgi:ferredoxin